MKGLEALQEIVFDINTDKKYQEAYYLVLKQVKASKILIEKLGLSIFLKYGKEPYLLSRTFNDFEKLTQEEYELLKEILQ